MNSTSAINLRQQLILITLQSVSNTLVLLEWVTGLEPALYGFAIRYLTIQCTPTYLWHGMQESNPHS